MKLYPVKEKEDLNGQRYIRSGGTKELDFGCGEWSKHSQSNLDAGEIGTSFFYIRRQNHIF